MMRLRTPRSKSSFSVKDIQDLDLETPELEIIPEATEQKRRKLLDDIDGGKVKSTNELHGSNKDGGGRGQVYSRQLGEGQPAKRSLQLQRIVSDKQHNDGSVYHNGFSRLNSSHEQQHVVRTRSNAQNNFVGRMRTCSTVKNTRSSETFTEINPPSLPTSSSKRLSNRSSASSMEQIGASHGNLVKQNRADEIGICSKCQRIWANLYRNPGCTGSDSLCSACRRKSKAVDPDFSLITDFQIYGAKSPRSGQKQQNGKRERDVIGRTPDTAMEIDSSDEEKEAADYTGSVMNPCERHLQSGLQKAVNRMEGFKIAYPSRTDPEAVEISASDIQRLNPLEFLNDTIIDFYIKYIQKEFLSLEGGRRFHFFNSFFYKKLSGVVGKKPVLHAQKKVPDFSKLRKWTRGVNIFEKDYLFIPVHDKLHWSLAIVCFPNHGPGSASGCERCILHLDSMTCGHDSLTVFRFVRRYLVAEGAEVEGDDSIKSLTSSVIPARKVLVPLQENESDCGLFLLHYIRKFAESAPTKMKMSDVENRLENIGLFGRQWFFPIEASSLRTSIQEHLQRLFAQNGGALDVSSDASPEAFEVGIPRKLETEFWHMNEICYLVIIPKQTSFYQFETKKKKSSSQNVIFKVQEAVAKASKKAVKKGATLAVPQASGLSDGGGEEDTVEDAPMLVPVLPIVENKKIRLEKVQVGLSMKRGCQCNFKAKQLYVDPSLCQIQFHYMTHTNAQGQPCHGIQFGGIRHALFGCLSWSIKQWIETSLRIGLSPAQVLALHKQEVMELSWQNKATRDTFIMPSDVYNIAKKLAKELYEKHPLDAKSVQMWVDENPDSHYHYQQSRDLDLNNNSEEDAPFCLAVQTNWQLDMMVRHGH